MILALLVAAVGAFRMRSCCKERSPLRWVTKPLVGVEGPQRLSDMMLSLMEVVVGWVERSLMKVLKVLKLLELMGSLRNQVKERRMCDGWKRSGKMRDGGGKGSWV